MINSPPSTSLYYSNLFAYPPYLFFISQDEEEEESQEPAQPTIPTNLNYAQLKLQQEDLQDALKAAKEESGDGGVVLQDINAKLREVKMQMEEVARNKDYNPKTANIEFRRLVEEKNEAAKSKKKKQQQPQQQQQQIDGSGGDLFGDMFSEDATATTSSGRSSSNTTIVIRDMSYTNWTGKSPFQYFRDYLSKQAKGCKITFQNISDGKSGIRLKVTLKGGPKDYDGQTEEMGAEERVGNQKEAEHYACTKLMYKLMKDRPVHRLLPKPYAELWLEFSTAEKLVDKIDKLSEDEERIQFLVKLRNHVLKSIGSSSSKDDSAATTSSLMMDSSSPNNFSAKDKSSMALRSNPTFSQKMLEEYSLRQSNTNYKKLLVCITPIHRYILTHSQLTLLLLLLENSISAPSLQQPSSHYPNDSIQSSCHHLWRHWFWKINANTSIYIGIRD